MARVDALYEAVLNGNRDGAIAITNESLAGGVSAESLVTESMIPAMDEVGRRFEANEFFVPELLIAARAMKSCLEILKPLLAEEGAEAAGTVAIGTVKGDLHDIGKNLVAAMLEGGGFEVVDLGVDVSPEKFVEAIKSRKANVVCLSALLTTTMPSMKSIIEAIDSAGVRDQVKVIIGGAPVTQQYADEIGADFYGDNANAAVTRAREALTK